MLLTNNLGCDRLGIHRCSQRSNGAVYSLQLERQGRQWCCEEERPCLGERHEGRSSRLPDEELSPAEFQGIVNHIGKRGVKRQFNAIEANPNQKTPRWSHSILEKSRRAGQH